MMAKELTISERVKQTRRNIHFISRQLLLKTAQIPPMVADSPYGLSPNYRCSQAEQLWRSAATDLQQMTRELNQIKSLINEFKKTAISPYADEQSNKAGA